MLWMENTVGFTFHKLNVREERCSGGSIITQRNGSLNIFQPEVKLKPQTEIKKQQREEKQLEIHSKTSSDSLNIRVTYSYKLLCVKTFDLSENYTLFV